MVSKIAPSFITTIVIKNFANPGSGMFLRKLGNNRSKIGARGLRKAPLPLFHFPYYPYTNSKDKNLCISPNNKRVFCFVAQKICFIF